MQEKQRLKTPERISVGPHRFTRYLFSNEYAEEMLCRKCGFVIWPCWTEEEAVKAIKILYGDPESCKK